MGSNGSYRATTCPPIVDPSMRKFRQRLINSARFLHFDLHHQNGAIPKEGHVQVVARESSNDVLQRP